MGTTAPLFEEMNAHIAAGRNHRRAEGLPRLRAVLEAYPDAPAETFASAIPFSAGDTTFGAENELQAVVAGTREHVDLPVTIQDSNYYRNLLERAEKGETPRRRPSRTWSRRWRINTFSPAGSPTPTFRTTRSSRANAARSSSAAPSAFRRFSSAGTPPTLS